jgi:hypothetical protein
MTDKVRVALSQYKRDNPQLSQKDLIKWLEDNHNIKVSQATISTTLKWPAEILAKSNNETNFNAKRQWTVRYSEMESVLVKWFRANQERANVSGELVRESATKILDRLYPGHEPFEFSSGWLEAFQSHHGIWINMHGRTSIIWTKLDFSIGCRYCKFRFVYCKCLNMI